MTMDAASSAAPPLPAELTTDSAALEQLRLLLTGGGVDLHSLKNTEQGEGFETRSGRISRRPHHAPFPARPSEEPKATTSDSTEANSSAGPLPPVKKSRGPGRPRILTEEERTMRRRARNKEAGECYRTGVADTQPS